MAGCRLGTFRTLSEVSLSCAPWVPYLPHLRVGHGEQPVRDGAPKALVCPWSSSGADLLSPVASYPVWNGAWEGPGAGPCLWAQASDFLGGMGIPSEGGDCDCRLRSPESLGALKGGLRRGSLACSHVLSSPPR